MLASEVLLVKSSSVVSDSTETEFANAPDATFAFP